MAQVFLSWSGARSRAMANALKEWLPGVLQGLSVWMSDHDIRVGGRWLQELTDQLEASHVGVLCLTPDNLGSHWLIFEAGALSKIVDEACVIPYRLALKATDVGPPLGQFQGVDASRDGTLQLVRSIHRAVESALADETLVRSFEAWWPQLEGRIAEIARDEGMPRRSEREILEEILGLVRQTGSRELQETLGRVLALPHVQSMTVKRQFRGGQPTGGLSLTVNVHRKRPLVEVPADERIPDEIYGMATKVREVRAEET